MNIKLFHIIALAFVVLYSPYSFSSELKDQISEESRYKSLSVSLNERFEKFKNTMNDPNFERTGFFDEEVFQEGEEILKEANELNEYNKSNPGKFGDFDNEKLNYVKYNCAYLNLKDGGIAKNPTRAKELLSSIELPSSQLKANADKLLYKLHNDLSAD